MRWSSYFLNTTREVPADAEVVSHRLMARSGMIKRLAAGIYIYQPFGWRSLAKCAAIVRSEMDRAGAQEPDACQNPCGDTAFVEPDIRPHCNPIPGKKIGGDHRQCRDRQAAQPSCL